MKNIIKKQDYNYNNSSMVKPQDLNPSGSLFGGRLLEWLDEKAAIFCYCQIKYQGQIVTKLISEINFISSAVNGNIIEYGFKVTDLGKSSITLACIVKNKHTKKEILKIDKMVFVQVDPKTKKSIPHGFTLES